MSDQCLSFVMTSVRWRQPWQSSVFLRILLKLGSSWPLIYPAISQYIDTIASENNENGEEEDDDGGVDDDDDDEDEETEGRNSANISYEEEEEAAAAEEEEAEYDDDGDGLYPWIQMERKWYISNGGSDRISLFSQRGRSKEINQDSMLAWERFGGEEEAQGIMFCGVFDGHGRDGHRVSRSVRDRLPKILARAWQHRRLPCLEDRKHYHSSSTSSCSDDSESDTDSMMMTMTTRTAAARDPSHIFAWKESFLAAYGKMDKELARRDFDALSSGTTAVSLIKQGDDLIVANVGDSRAVLGTRADDDSMLALQLTVDLKPDIPREAERIRRLKGRVFPLPEEPSVHRVWLPYRKSPGLAMARTLGDHCLKEYGVISEPEVTYRRLSPKDEFVVLASDGVWDVLTNEEVVETVASTCDRSFAAKAVVGRAIDAWKAKKASSKTDDCAVVCLFFV